MWCGSCCSLEYMTENLNDKQALSCTDQMVRWLWQSHMRPLSLQPWLLCGLEEAGCFLKREESMFYVTKLSVNICCLLLQPWPVCRLEGAGYCLKLKFKIPIIRCWYLNFYLYNVFQHFLDAVGILDQQWSYNLPFTKPFSNGWEEGLALHWLDSLANEQSRLS